MHVDDLASAIIFILQNYSEMQTINIGTGRDISISEFANLIKKITGYKGKILFDTGKPDGTMVKKTGRN